MFARLTLTSSRAIDLANAGANRSPGRPWTVVGSPRPYTCSEQVFRGAVDACGQPPILLQIRRNVRVSSTVHTERRRFFLVVLGRGSVVSGRAGHIAE